MTAIEATPRKKPEPVAKVYKTKGKSVTVHYGPSRFDRREGVYHTPCSIYTTRGTTTNYTTKTYYCDFCRMALPIKDCITSIRRSDGKTVFCHRQCLLANGDLYK